MRWSILVCLFVCAQRLVGQPEGACSFTLQGRVLDRHDRAPLAYAEVILEVTGQRSVADEEGRFRFVGVCAGTWTLRAVHAGCDPVVQSVSVKGDRTFDIYLEHHEQLLQDLEVVRARPDENVGHAHGTIGKSEMESLAGKSLADMLATMPGVGALNSGPTIGKPIIHGVSGNRVLILNQGIRQEDQQWGGEHAPNLDPFSTDRITVVKGAASVQYGSDALGGVVITEPVDLPTEGGLRGEVRGIGLWNGRGGGGTALLQGGVGRLRGLGWRVQGSGRYLGDSEAPDYMLSNTGVREDGVSASVGYRNVRWNASAYYSLFQRELGILRASHIGNLTDLENALATGRPWYVQDPTYSIDAPRQAVQHHLVKAEAGHAVGARGRIVLTYGYQADDRQEYDLRRGGRTGIPSIDLFLTTHTGDLVFKHWLGERLHGKAGVSAVYQENINVPGTGIRPLLPNYRKEALGAFVLEHLPLGDRWELEGGARLEGTRLHVARYSTANVLEEPEHAFTNGAFTLGANWSVRDSVRVRWSIGSAYRPPHVSELYSEGLHHGAAAIERGDAGLGSERALKASVDLEAAWFDGRLRTDITLYADRVYDYIYLRPSGTSLTIRGAFPVFQYTATDVTIHGVDATIAYDLSDHVRLRSRTSLVRGRDLRQDEWLFQMPSDRTELAVLYRVAKAGVWSDLECGVTEQFVFTQSRVPIGLDFTEAPPGYQLLGASVSATRALGANELRVGLQAYNVLDAAYRDYMDRFRYYADARGVDVVLWIRYAFGKGE